MIPVEVTQASWHFTTVPDLLDHWQSLAAGLVALLAALVAVLGSEFFARCKERREVQSLRDSLASEIRLYFDLLIKGRKILTRSKDAFRRGGQVQQDFSDLIMLPLPVVYPVAADRLGHMGKPKAADVVEFYGTIERLKYAVKAMSNEPTLEVSMSNYKVIIEVFEKACRKSLPLLSELPPDDRDAEFRADIAKWGS